MQFGVLPHLCQNLHPGQVWCQELHRFLVVSVWLCLPFLANGYFRRDFSHWCSYLYVAHVPMISR